MVQDKGSRTSHLALPLLLEEGMSGAGQFHKAEAESLLRVSLLIYA
jgi:hypothetical protein